MTQFPLLKTGAVTQYGSRKSKFYSTEVSRFVDGAEQRSPEFGTCLRRWTVRLELVDEGELAALDLFFSSHNGQAGSFGFTDPWDGTVYPDCSIEDSEITVTLDGPSRGRSHIVIRENRT